MNTSPWTRHGHTKRVTKAALDRQQVDIDSVVFCAYDAVDVTADEDLVSQRPERPRRGSADPRTTRTRKQILVVVLVDSGPGLRSAGDRSPAARHAESPTCPNGEYTAANPGRGNAHRAVGLRLSLVGTRRKAPDGLCD